MKIRKGTEFTRRGMMVTITVFMIGVSANTLAIKYHSDSHYQYMAVRSSADGFRARQAALGGFQAGMAALKYVPEKYLYKMGLALNPPDLLLSQDCKPKCFISYRLQPEDGRLNVNSLIQTATDEQNKQMRPVFERFFRNYDFKKSEATVDAIIDWLDENTDHEPNGAEGEDYYLRLNPPIKIKDGQMYSLSEICQIKGITYKLIYDSQAPADWVENQKELKFQTEEEKTLIQEADWIPANNLTAYILPSGDSAYKININAARYHVLMALSDSMSKEAVMALFKLREQKDNYLENLGDLKTLPEFQLEVGEGLTLYDEVVGSSTELSGFLKTKGEIYRLTGVGTIAPPADNESVSPVVRRVTGLYDVNNKVLIYYSED